MSSKPYGLICPITRACDVLEPRWTIPILSELWAGATKFNEVRRGVGNISPALLSKRLKELEERGLIERIEDPATGAVDYVRASDGEVRVRQEVFDPGNVVTPNWALEVDMYEAVVIR